ncbi:MAG TPA: hypothetical protein VFZ69_10475 [Longimicrobiales bacterium]
MRKVMLLGSIVIATACASGSAPSAARTGGGTVRVVGGGEGGPQITTTAVGDARVGTVTRPRDQVWAALPDVYRSLGIEVAQRDSRTGVIGNAGFKARRRLGSVPISRYLDCGTAQGGRSADTYEVHLSVLTEVRPATPGNTTVSTMIEATARPVSFAGDPVRCVTNGELENRIFVALLAEG